MVVRMDGHKLRLSCPHREDGLCPACAARAVRQAADWERRRLTQLLKTMLAEEKAVPEVRFALGEALARLGVEQ